MQQRLTWPRRSASLLQSESQWLTVKSHTPAKTRKASKAAARRLASAMGLSGNKGHSNTRIPIPDSRKLFSFQITFTAFIQVMRSSHLLAACLVCLVTVSAAAAASRHVLFATCTETCVFSVFRSGTTCVRTSKSFHTCETLSDTGAHTHTVTPSQATQATRSTVHTPPHTVSRPLARLPFPRHLPLRRSLLPRASTPSGRKAPTARAPPSRS